MLERWVELVSLSAVSGLSLAGLLMQLRLGKLEERDWY